MDLSRSTASDVIVFKAMTSLHPYPCPSLLPVHIVKHSVPLSQQWPPSSNPFRASIDSLFPCYIILLSPSSKILLLYLMAPLDASFTSTLLQPDGFVLLFPLLRKSYHSLAQSLCCFCSKLLMLLLRHVGDLNIASSIPHHQHGFACLS